MINKIVLFNHYHRGDIFTNREFIKHLRNQLKDIEFSYLHFNHPKLTRDMGIPLIGSPSNLNQHTKFFVEESSNSLYINTWIGADPKFMAANKGLNLHAMYDQWLEIFSFVSGAVGKEIFIYEDKEDYLPTVEYDHFNLDKINSYLQCSNNKRVLICNGAPKSGQSFTDNMADFINEAAEKYKSIDFICTQKFDTSHTNIFFTDEIIGDTEKIDKRAPWEDKDLNICDLLEIAYLSEHCNLIIGKNSGPAVFCETYTNFMNPEKHYISFVVRWNSGNVQTESMTYNLPLQAKYNIVMINDRNLSPTDVVTIKNTIDSTLSNL